MILIYIYITILVAILMNVREALEVTESWEDDAQNQLNQRILPILVASLDYNIHTEAEKIIAALQSGVSDLGRLLWGLAAKLKRIECEQGRGFDGDCAYPQASFDKRRSKWSLNEGRAAMCTRVLFTSRAQEYIEDAERHLSTLQLSLELLSTMCIVEDGEGKKEV